MYVCILFSFAYLLQGIVMSRGLRAQTLAPVSLAMYQPCDLGKLLNFSVPVSSSMKWRLKIEST